jgi:acyl carrier protein
VHLPGDELVTAVVPGAGALPFEDFLATCHAQIQRAQEGDDQASSIVQLLITHLGRLPVTNATPILVSPAAGVLFVGAMPAGAGGIVNLTLGFDHRLLNGVAAAKFVCEIGRRIADLGRVTVGGDRSCAAGRSGTPTRGDLRELLEAIPPGDRKLFFQNQIGRIMASLVQCDITQITPRQALRNQGLDSLLATELSMALSKCLNLDIPATLVWNYPTTEAIADHLLDRLGMKVAAPSKSSNGVMPTESLLVDIERMSDGQVQALLDVLPRTPL